MQAVLDVIVNSLGTHLAFALLKLANDLVLRSVSVLTTVLRGLVNVLIQTPRYFSTWSVGY